MNVDERPQEEWDLEVRRVPQSQEIHANQNVDEEHRALDPREDVIDPAELDAHI